MKLLFNSLRELISPHTNIKRDDRILLADMLSYTSVDMQQSIRSLVAKSFTSHKAISEVIGERFCTFTFLNNNEFDGVLIISTNHWKSSDRSKRSITRLIITQKPDKDKRNKHNINSIDNLLSLGSTMFPLQSLVFKNFKVANNFHSNKCVGKYKELLASTDNNENYTVYKVSSTRDVRTSSNSNKLSIGNKYPRDIRDAESVEEFVEIHNEWVGLKEPVEDVLKHIYSDFERKFDKNLVRIYKVEKDDGKVDVNYLKAKTHRNFDTASRAKYIENSSTTLAPYSPMKLYSNKYKNARISPMSKDAYKVVLALLEHVWSVDCKITSRPISAKEIFSKAGIHLSDDGHHNEKFKSIIKEIHEANYFTRVYKTNTWKKRKAYSLKVNMTNNNKKGEKDSASETPLPLLSSCRFVFRPLIKVAHSKHTYRNINFAKVINIIDRSNYTLDRTLGILCSTICDVDKRKVGLQLSEMIPSNGYEYDPEADGVRWHASVKNTTKVGYVLDEASTRRRKRVKIRNFFKREDVYVEENIGAITRYSNRRYIYNMKTRDICEIVRMSSESGSVDSIANVWQYKANYNPDKGKKYVSHAYKLKAVKEAPGNLYTGNIQTGSMLHKILTKQFIRSSVDSYNSSDGDPYYDSYVDTC